MTPSVTAMLIDDIGQPEASETVCFGVDGSAYEIDLPARQASELRSMAGRYISVARRVRLRPEPASSGKATRKSVGRTGIPRAGQDEPAAMEGMSTEAAASGGGHGLTAREKQELRTIAEAARPERSIVAGRLRAKGLADRDSAGNWWLTDVGRRELISA